MIQKITVNNDEVLVVLNGEISVESASVLREALMQQVNNGLNKFNFDFSAVKFIDSAGLGVLVGIHNRIKEKNGWLAVCGLQGPIKELFELTKLDKLFHVRNNSK